MQVDQIHSPAGNAGISSVKAMRSLERLTQHDWILLIVIAPILLFAEAQPIWLVCLALVLLGAYFVRRLLDWSRRSLTPIHLPMLFLVMTVPLGLYASVNFQMTMPMLVRLLLGIAVYLAVEGLPERRTSVLAGTAILILSEFPVSLIGLFGTDLAAKIAGLSTVIEHLPRLSEVIRSGSPAGFNQNAVAAALILTIPLNLALLPGPFFATASACALRGWRDLNKPAGRLAARALLAFLALLSMTTLVLTQSRSAFVGLIAALILLIALRKKELVLSAAILAVFGVALTFILGFDRIGHLLLDVGTNGSPIGTFDFASRVEIWQRAIYMLQDFPLTGIGMNTFPLVANELYPFFLLRPDVMVPHAHNMLLNVGVELGIFGLVAYVALVTTFFAMAWRVHRQTDSDLNRAVVTGLVGGMIALQVYGLTDALPLGARNGLAFWPMLGVMGSLWMQASRPHPDCM